MDRKYERALNRYFNSLYRLGLKHGREIGESRFCDAPDYREWFDAGWRHAVIKRMCAEVGK